MVSLLLETSVVGFIIITDITRVGDVIRNLTYDAFFPLFTVAVIYFILATVILGVIGIVEKRMDPRRRSNNDVLKKLGGKIKE